MSSHTIERTSETGWFDSVIQQLDLLQKERHDDDESIAPKASQYEMAKRQIENLRIAAAFPNMPTPQVYAGVNCDIAIAFDFPPAKLELVVVDRIFARIYNHEGQAFLDLARVPEVLQMLSSDIPA